MQHSLEQSMSDDGWSAWVATADTFLPEAYIVRNWERVAPTFEPGLQRFIDDRQRAPVS